MANVSWLLRLMKETHIFIIESEAIVRLDLRLQLESMGYIIHWAIPFTDLKEALRKLNPDLIIINFTSRNQESFPLIRETMSQLQIPIIYLGVDTIADANIDPDLNIVATVSIPYMTNDIINLVKKCLQYEN